MTVWVHYLIETGVVVSDKVSGAYDVDDSVTRADMIGLLLADLNERMTPSAHTIVGPVHVDRFTVEDA